MVTLEKPPIVILTDLEVISIDRGVQVLNPSIPLKTRLVQKLAQLYNHEITKMARRMLTASCLRHGFRAKYNCFPVSTLTPGGDGRIRLKVSIDTTFDPIHLTHGRFVQNRNTYANYV